jgi:16S rRNA (guanine966-N2)-methyltransferase
MSVSPTSVVKQREMLTADDLATLEREGVLSLGPDAENVSISTKYTNTWDVFLLRRQVIEAFGRHFDVLDYLPGHQDLVVLRTPPAGQPPAGWPPPSDPARLRAAAGVWARVTAGPVVRVVGGSARGRRLVAPPGDRTRPTSDRVREAIFNALWSRGVIDGARVVDLFAGSGALGVEALSRGAAHATFVDSDAAARRAIAANLATTGLADRATVVAQSVERFLASLAPGGVAEATGAAAGEAATGRTDERTPFDVAFCDPPYAFTGWDAVFAARPAPLVVAESGTPLAAPEGWSCVRESRYGAAWVGFLQLDR